VLMACFSVFALLTTIVVRRCAMAGVRRVTKSWADNVGDGMYSQMDRMGAINELQDAIHGSFWFALLRRLTGIAPLVGVMLSALAFWSAEGGASGSDSAGGMEVLKSLRPAFSGVVVGAIWAVINQIVVLLLEPWIQEQVAKAVSKCDSHKIGSANAIPSKLVSEVEGFGRAVVACQEAMIAVQAEFAEGSARQLKRYVAASDQLEASAVGAAKRLETASDSLFVNMREFTSEYAKAVRSMTKTVERLDSKMTLYLTDAADANRDAADANREARDAIRQALAETQQAVSNLSSELGRSLSALASSAEIELQSFRSVAIAASEESANSIRAAAEQMSGSVASSMASLSASLQSQQSSTGAALSDSLRTFGREMAGSLVQASSAASGLSDAASGLARLRTDLEDPVRSIAAQSERLAMAAEQLASLTSDIASRRASSESGGDAAAAKFDDVSRRIIAWADQMRNDLASRDARLESLDRRLFALGELLRERSGSPVPQPEAAPS